MIPAQRNSGEITGLKLRFSDRFSNVVNKSSVSLSVLPALSSFPGSSHNYELNEACAALNVDQRLY